MYTALNYWVYGGFEGAKSACEFISWGAQQGLDGVELTVGDAIPLDISAEECRKIADFAAEQGIGLRTLATGAYWQKSLGAADEEERAEAVAFSKKYLKIAYQLGAETVLIVPGATRIAWDPSRPVISYETVWQQSSKSLKELLPLAEELEVNIALENVWSRFLFSPMEWKTYLDQFGSPRIGMYFDVGNCCLYVRPQDYIEILGDRIKAVHIKNWAGDELAGGNLHGFGEDLFKGEVDFKAVLSSLNARGCSGPLTAEMIPFSRLPDLNIPDEDLATATCQSLKQIVNG